MQSKVCPNSPLNIELRLHGDFPPLRPLLFPSLHSLAQFCTALSFDSTLLIAYWRNGDVKFAPTTLTGGRAVFFLNFFSQPSSEIPSACSRSTQCAAFPCDIS